MAWRGVAWRGVALRLRSAVIDCVLQAAEDPVRGRAHDDLLPVLRQGVRPPVERVIDLFITAGGDFPGRRADAGRRPPPPYSMHLASCLGQEGGVFPHNRII